MVYLTEVVSRAMMGISRLDPTGADRVELDVEQMLVYADPGLLERVLANLIDNALRHSGQATSVQVRAWSDPLHSAKCTVSVSDHGSGVPAESWDKIFTAFQRLGDSGSGNGVGLGLSVAQGFVHAMGSEITPSETLGGGLTMSFDLPSGPPRRPLVSRWRY